MNKSDISKTFEILLVEDNPSDARLAMESFKNTQVRNNLHVVSDGEMAMDFLERKGSYAEAPRPDIILLDLNLPKKSGIEILAEIKANEKWRRIPVAILTGSEDEKDIKRTYDLGANCFISKPVDSDEFIKVAESIQEFWFTIVKLPTD